MQEKPNNKMQLEDYFRAAADRRSMYSRSEIEQLISTENNPVKGRKPFSNTKTNLLIILTIMTLLTTTIAALIFVFMNPEQDEKTKAQKIETITSESEIITPDPELKKVQDNSFFQQKESNLIEPKKSSAKPGNNKKNKITAKPDKTSEIEGKSISPKEEFKMVTIPLKSEEKEQPKTPETKSKNDSQVKLEGIHLIELSREELLQMGFKVIYDSILFSGSGDNYNFGFSKGGTVLKLTNSSTPGKKSKKGKIFPDLVTDDLGNWRTSKISKSGSKGLSFKLGPDQPLTVKFDETYKLDSASGQIKKAGPVISKDRKNKVASMDEVTRKNDLRIIERINTFIPILVKTGVEFTKEDSINQRHRPDLILWYEVNDDFLKTLPKDLRRKIENEYNQLTRQPEKLEQTATATNCEYFEVCRSTLKSAADVVVFPNPAIESATMRFSLKEEAVLRVNLYDISGRLVRELKPFSSLSRGQQELPLNLDGITEGMYLIVLESDKGETNIQRLVKGKN